MIYFRKIRYRNFLSFGDRFTEIQLDRSPTTLVTGENGAGKSTMLDALTFVLYNKPFRKINKPQLVNSINRKQCLVEIEFDIGGKCYLVRRGIKPNVFEIFEHTSYEGIEDHLMHQDAATGDYQEILEKDVLKMNYKAFTQIVILGKATFVPFMRMTTGDRRQVIEDLLGLRIFGVMNKLLKEKQKTLKRNLKEVEDSIFICEDKIENRQRYIDDMNKDRTDQIEQARLKIEELNNSITEHRKGIEDFEDSADELEDTIADSSDVDAKIRRMDRIIAQLEAKMKTHEETVSFFVSNPQCPTCEQDIAESLRDTKISETKLKLTKLEEGISVADGDLKKAEDRMSEIEDVKSKVSSLERKIREYQAIIKQQERQINELSAQMNKLSTVSTEDDQKVVDELKVELKKLNNQRNELQETNAYYMTIGSMLKDDGMKTLIINKYLPIFNKLINDYLLRMGFIVKFTLDESFNENILSRYHDKFSYNNFSEGQKLRIDLAILLTWREVAKLKNSLNTNLLIMDEVFDSSLDQDGVDAFMEIIPSLGDSNIFVVSHTPDKLYDKFRSHLSFTLNQNFSNIDV